MLCLLDSILVLTPFSHQWPFDPEAVHTEELVRVKQVQIDYDGRFFRFIIWRVKGFRL